MTAPDWAPLDADKWGRFEKLVRWDITARGWDGDIREGIVSDGEIRYGLQNLVQKCASEPPGMWPKTVRDHFDSFSAPGNSLESLTPDQSRAALRARLLDDDFLAHVEWETVSRRLTEDLQLVLAYDLPDQVAITSRERLMELGEEDELWELALAQTRAEPGLQLQRHELQANEPGETVALLTLSGDSFFTATHVLWADALDPPTSPHGTLVAVPNRHVVLAHAIRDARFVGVLSHMIQLAAQFEARGPGSLSSDLYWLREGTLARLKAWQDDGGLHFEPGPAFEQMLARL